MLNFLLNILPSLAGIILGICYIPQIIHTIKTKNVEGISLGFWAILSVAITCLVINALVIFIQFGTWGYLLTEGMNLALALVMLTLVLKYRKGGKQ